MTNEAAREAIAEHLLSDALAHEGKRFDEIGRRFDALERVFPRGGEPELITLRIALTFWDGWIDARNRGWQQTRGIQPDEWPVLARQDDVVWIPGVCRSDALLPARGTEAIRVDAEYA